MFFQNKPLKGFTLIELLIALVIFAIFISSTSVILVHVQRGYEESLITQKLSSETFFVMEKMSQTLRRARAQRPGDPLCIPPGVPYEITPDGNGIRFIIDQGGIPRCQEFSLEEGTLRIIDIGLGERFNLLSPGLRAKRLNGLPIFSPISTGQPTTEQPGIHIHISIYTRTAAGVLITQESRTAISIRR